MRVVADAIEGVEGEFDDIVFFGADADAIERSCSADWHRGTMCVLGGERISRQGIWTSAASTTDFTASAARVGPARGLRLDPRQRRSANDRRVFVGAAG